MKLNEVKELRATFGHERVHRFEGFNKTQCGKYLQYKKRGDKEDGKMPDDLESRKARCILWMDRPSPTPSFDDGDDTPDSNVEANAVINGNDVAAVNINDDGTAENDDVDADAGDLFGVNDQDDGPSTAAMQI